VYVGRAYVNRHQHVVPTSPKANHHQRRNKKTTLRIRAQSEWIALDVPAVVDGETFAQAQLRLRKNTAQLAGRNTHFFYLLKGVLRCGACQHAFAGCPSHGRRYYRCLGRDRLKDNTCHTGLLHAEKIETFLWTIIRRALTDTGLLRTKLQEFYQSAHDERAALEDRLQQLECAQQATRGKESRLLDGYLELAITREAFTQKHSEILATLRSIDSGLVDVRRRLSAIDKSHVDRTIQSLKTATENLGRLNDDAKQRFLRALIDRITLTGRDVEILGILPAPATVANRAHHAAVLHTTRVSGQGDGADNFDVALGVDQDADAGRAVKECLEQVTLLRKLQNFAFFVFRSGQQSSSATSPNGVITFHAANPSIV
jgi:site-specific DNA recombinase